MLFLIIASFIALIIIFPYLRIFIKRVVLYFKLRTFCRRRCLRLHGGHPLWIFARKNDVRFDFYLDGDDTVFAVKLFALKRKTDILRFIDNESYRVRSHFGLISQFGARCVIPIDSDVRSLPEYTLEMNNDSGCTKTIHKILLIHPTCGEVCQRINGQEKIIGTGDPVGNMTICSFSTLDTLIRQYNQDKSAACVVADF